MTTTALMLNDFTLTDSSKKMLTDEVTREQVYAHCSGPLEITQQVIIQVFVKFCLNYVDHNKIAKSLNSFKTCLLPNGIFSSKHSQILAFTDCCVLMSTLLWQLKHFAVPYLITFSAVSLGYCDSPRISPKNIICLNKYYYTQSTRSCTRLSNNIMAALNLLLLYPTWFQISSGIALYLLGFQHVINDL